MRIRLSYKIFGVFLLTSFFIVAFTIGALRFFVYRDFAEYVNKMEMEKLGNLMDTLKVEYQNREGWQRLKSNRSLWRTIVESSFSQEDAGGPAQLPATHEFKKQEAEMPGPDMHPPPPKKDFFHMRPRLFLLDAQGHPVVGRPGTTDNHALMEIRVEDETVGWLGLRKRKPLKTRLEAAFLKQQYKWFYLLGGGIFVLTALVSFLLSRHFLAPIKQLTDGTQALTSRNFEARINVHSKDELGQLASGFNMMAQALEKYEQLRQQWISDISHELRTPLSVLRGEVEAMQDGIREMSRKTLDSLHSEVLRVAKIVNDLHELSLADTGDLSFKREPVNPLGVLKDTLRIFRTRLDRQNIQVNTPTLPPSFLAQGPESSTMVPGLEAEENPESDNDITLLGDADRLAQLFSNLLENTLRYADSPGLLKIRHKRTGNCLSIYFEDSGPGVPVESLEHLFDRLYRVDKSRSRALGGSGLGLSICKSIVETLGGEIRAANGPSGGLQIEIVLPLASG